MAARRPPFVLFAAAAGPHHGFGHLVRCGALAEALGGTREILLRGSARARLAALRFGWCVHEGRDVLAHLQPDLLVVDDPSADHTARWVRLARRSRVPVATVIDGGTAGVGADLVIDGSFMASPETAAGHLAGPAFAILHPGVAARRARRPRRRIGRVLITLGGGAHVRRLGAAIAAAVAGALPDIDVDLAAGFVLDRDCPALPPRCRWVLAPDGLDARLASASVAVVAGGLTLYEACALGTPVVAVPVVPGQRPAIAAAASAGAIVRVAARYEHHVPVEVAAAVTAVISTPALALGLSRRARRLVDGQGSARVAVRLRALCAPARQGARPHAA